MFYKKRIEMDKQNEYNFVPIYKDLINCIKCPKDAVEKAIDKTLKEFDKSRLK